MDENAIQLGSYTSLTGLNEEWEDIPEEPIQVHIEGIQKVYMDGCGRVFIEYATAEEAEKAVKKLKAWKRLKGGGFEFMSCSYGHDKTTDDTGGWICFRVNHLYDDRYGCEVEKDLDLLFGGEE